MPKTNLCQPRVDSRLEEVRAMITGGVARREVSLPWLAKKIGMPYSTLATRVQRPGEIRLEELYKIMEALQSLPDEKKRIIFKKGEQICDCDIIQRLSQVC